MAAIFTANLLKVLESLETFLPQLGYGLNPEGKLSGAHVWSKIEQVMPGTIRGYVKVLEEGTGSIMRWQNVEEWFSIVRQRLEGYRAKDIDLPPLKTRIRIDQTLRRLDRAREQVPSIQQLYERAITLNDPRANNIRDTFGPNWRQHCNDVSLLWSPVSNAHAAIPKELFEPKLIELSVEILQHWAVLRRARLDGSLSRIEAFWKKINVSDRVEMLQRHFPHLIRRPHDHLYQWARSKTKNNFKADKTAFLTPMLNTEDLSKDCCFIDLLKTRSEFHPGLFRISDSRSVLLGYWCTILQRLEAQGTVAFLATDLGRAGNQYGIVYECGDDSEKFSLNPAIAYYQLLAQSKVYRFFKDSISMCLEDLGSQVTLSDADSSEKAQGHELAKLPDVGQANPNNLEFGHMLQLLRAAEEEAMDELLQLRLDRELWSLRMCAAKSNDRSFAVLRSTFGRIDTFTTLCHHVEKVAAIDTSWSTRHKDSMFGGIVLLHKALQAVLNENLDRMQYLVWPDLTSLPTPLSQLLELLQTDAATIRVMGINAILATVQRELDATGTRGKLPFELQRAITDLSVVAVCMEETEKCSAFEICDARMTDYDHAVLSEEMRSEWSSRVRPWNSLLQNMLRRLEKSAKLSNRAPHTEHQDRQHLAFWTVVDTALRQEVEERCLAEMIVRCPLPVAQSLAASGTDEMPDFVGTDYSVEPSQTQIKKSSGKGRQLESSPTHHTRIVQQPVNVPTVYMTKARDLEFWAVLEADNGPALSFHDFCRFMIDIGYTLTPLPGSGRSFEYGQKNSANHHRFVFHEPHGHNGDKLPWSVARRQWRDRLRRRIDIRSDEIS